MILFSQKVLFLAKLFRYYAMIIILISVAYSTVGDLEKLMFSELSSVLLTFLKRCPRNLSYVIVSALYSPLKTLFYSIWA